MKQTLVRYQKRNIPLLDFYRNHVWHDNKNKAEIIPKEKFERLLYEYGILGHVGSKLESAKKYKVTHLKALSSIEEPLQVQGLGSAFMYLLASLKCIYFPSYRGFGITEFKTFTRTIN